MLDDLEWPSVWQFSFVGHNATEQYTLHHPFIPNFRRECLVYDVFDSPKHTQDHFPVDFQPIVVNSHRSNTNFIAHIDFFSVHFVMQIVAYLMVNSGSSILHFLYHHLAYFWLLKFRN